MSHGFDFLEGWVEILFFILLVLGFIIGISNGSKVLSYITIFFCGAIFGRFLYERKEKTKAGYYIIILGFLIGYLISVRYGDWKVITILFLLGTLICYYLFDKGFLHDLPY